MSYVDFDYKPGNDIVCTFGIKATDVMDAAEKVAGESSVGTWTEVRTMKPRILEMAPRIFEIKGNRVKIAYPSALFEAGNMAQIFSSVAGNVFGMKAVDALRLEDIEFPESIVKSFKGPGFGIEGIRKLLKVRNRPLVGTIVKPKVGLNPEEHAETAYNAWVGGCDIVKDDENLTSQDFNPFEKRVGMTLKMRDRAEQETGEKKVYMPNVSAETREMLRRAELVKSLGGRYIMVDVVTCGFSGLQSVRDADLGMVIHAHRAMHAAMTRNEEHGISMLTLAKTYRLIGVDQLHVGTVIGKMEGPREEVMGIKKELEKPMHGKKRVLSVSSGGLYPCLVPELMKMFGRDFVIQAGGGIHGHPGGTIAGARAMRQAINSVVEGVPIDDYAGKHAELKKAIERWGGLPSG
jgi:ribulose-bisphosphate carboxylase large chain